MHPAEIVFEATPNDQRGALLQELVEGDTVVPTVIAGWLIKPIFADEGWVGFDFNGYGLHVYLSGEPADDQVTHLIRALELWLTPADGEVEELDFSHLCPEDPGEGIDYEDIDDAALVEEVLDLPI